MIITNSHYNKWVIRQNGEESDTAIHGLLVYSDEIGVTEELILKKFYIEKMLGQAGEVHILAKFSNGEIWREICASNFSRVNFAGDHLRSHDIEWALARWKPNCIMTKYKA